MPSKQDIIEKTTRLFLEYGVKSMRMDDIAVRLGVSKRTLYEMFGDREHLIVNCVDHYLGEQDRRMKEIMAPARNIFEEFMYVLDFADQGESSGKQKFFGDLERFYPSIARKIKNERRQQGEAQLREKLREGVRDGWFQKNLNLDFASYMLTESLNTVLINPAAYRASNISATEAFKYITMCFFRGISTARGIEQVDKLMRARYRKDKIREKQQEEKTR